LAFLVSFARNTGVRNSDFVVLLDLSDCVDRFHSSLRVPPPFRIGSTTVIQVGQLFEDPGTISIAAKGIAVSIDNPNVILIRERIVESFEFFAFIIGESFERRGDKRWGFEVLGISLKKRNFLQDPFARD
jgi:hypothetical protein